MYGTAEQGEWVEREVPARTHSPFSLWPVSCHFITLCSANEVLVDLPRGSCLFDCFSVCLYQRMGRLGDTSRDCSLKTPARLWRVAPTAFSSDVPPHSL